MNQCRSYCRLIKRMADLVVLPSGYQRVNYLQSSGSQYINIGPLGNHQYFDFDVEAVSYNYTSFFNSYGVNGILGTNAYGRDVKVWLSKANAITLSINNVSLGYIENALSNRYNIYLSPTLVKCNGVQINTDTTTSSTLNANCYVFAINSYTNSPQHSCIKLYHLKTSNIDLYPCRRTSDNKAGMYDIIHNNFYANAGSGSFATG